jgi:hypothetical protein
MLWFVVFVLTAVSAQGAVWPEKFGAFTRKDARTADMDAQNRSILEEFGFLSAEAAAYVSPAGDFAATAYRFRDSTGALAYFESQRPASARPSQTAEIAVETPAQVLLLHANYVLRFDGRKPRTAELKQLFASLDEVNQAPLPTLRRYLPQTGLVPNSQRYVLGPASLAAFEPRIPEETAAFEFSTEAYVGRYRVPGGEASLAVFSYPNPHIARSRIEEFQKIPGTFVKRSGPLLAVVLGLDAPNSAAATQELLAQVNYQGEVTVSEVPPPVPQNPGNAGEMLISIFTLAGLLLLLCLAGGILMGIFRIGGRQLFGSKNAPEANECPIHTISTAFPQVVEKWEINLSYFFLESYRS